MPPELIITPEDAEVLRLNIVPSPPEKIAEAQRHALRKIAVDLPSGTIVRPDVVGDDGLKKGSFPEVPRVMVATPHYGQTSPGWALGYYAPVRHGTEIAWVRQQALSNSSVLPNSFNQLLVNALNACHKGIITHFAMLHADIKPEIGWLEKLWAEMSAASADLIAAVVPIKNDSGRTSTAVGLAHDRWAIPRCVYLRERHDLPTTFSIEDLEPDWEETGKRLLVNTGCMLMDLRRPWFKALKATGRPFAFQFHTRIGYDDEIAKTGVGDPWWCEQRSEDWEMSHDIADEGGRVVATWAVKLKHSGEYDWSNEPPPRPTYAAAQGELDEIKLEPIQGRA